MPDDEEDEVPDREKNTETRAETVLYPRGRHPNTLKNLAPRWQPGQSGNPSGRRPTFKDKLLRAIDDGDRLVEVATDILLNGRDTDRLEALKFITDRVYGRAVETTVQIQADAHRLGTRVDLAPEALEALARAIGAAPPAATLPATQNPSDAHNPLITEGELVTAPLTTNQAPEEEPPQD